MRMGSSSSNLAPVLGFKRLLEQETQKHCKNIYNMNACDCSYIDGIIHGNTNRFFLGKYKSAII